MEIFRLRDEPPEDMPEDLKRLLEKITDTIKKFTEAEGLTLADHPVDGMEDHVKADHLRVEALAKHMQSIRGISASQNTDGNKLRYLAMQLYIVALEDGNCVHDNAPAEDLTHMADRLDELDLKESEIGA